MTALGVYLKKVRLALRLSLRDAEESSGVSNAYISLIESGKRTNPHPKILKDLAKAYGLDIVELMKIAGYLDMTPSKENEKAEVERLFREATSNPEFGFGRRSKTKLDYETKKAIANMYKKLKKREK